MERMAYRRAGELRIKRVYKFPGDLAAGVKQQALAEDASESQFVRRVLAEYLERVKASAA